MKWRAIFCEVSLWRSLWSVLTCLFAQTYQGIWELHCRWCRKVQHYRKLSEQVPYKVPEFTVIYFHLFITSSFKSCFVHYCKARDYCHLIFPIPWRLTVFGSDLYWCCLRVVGIKEKAEWEDGQAQFFVPSQISCSAQVHSYRPWSVLPSGACGGHQERCRQRSSKLIQVFPSQIQLRSQSNEHSLFYAKHSTAENTIIIKPPYL